MQTNLLEEYQRLQTGESTRAVAYLRLRRALQNLMDAGVLRPGQALPSERDLAQLLDLSDRKWSACAAAGCRHLRGRADP